MMLAIQNKMGVIKQQNLGKQRGISVLEVMLSLAIIAVILVMATRYYKTAEQSEQVKNALNMLGGIVAAQVDYATANSNQYATTLAELSTGGYLPPGVAANDPWGNPIGLAPASGGSGFVITFTSVPVNVCNELSSIVNQQQAGTASTCGDGTGTVPFSATYG